MSLLSGRGDLLPAAFFLSVLSPEATQPNALIYLAYVGGASLAAGLLMLAVGLIRGVAIRCGTEAQIEEFEINRWMSP